MKFKYITPRFLCIEEFFSSEILSLGVGYPWWFINWSEGGCRGWGLSSSMVDREGVGDANFFLFLYHIVTVGKSVIHVEQN